MKDLIALFDRHPEYFYATLAAIVAIFGEGARRRYRRRKIIQQLKE